MSFDAYKALMLPTLSYFGFEPDNWTIDKSLHKKPNQLNSTNGAWGVSKPRNCFYLM